MEEESSDSENRNPSSSSAYAFEKDLKKYKVRLAPPGIRKPSKREAKDARRCMQSGMVPGAIRKYLIQKKNQQAKRVVVAAAGEDDEEHSGGSCSATSSPGPSNNYNNNNNGPEEEPSDKEEEGRVEEEEDEDEEEEVFFIEEFPKNNGDGGGANGNNVLGEVNVDQPLVDVCYEDIDIEENINMLPPAVEVEVKGEGGGRFENDPLDSDETDVEDDNEEETEERASDSSSVFDGINKRLYAQAFSPDSTTPDVNLMGVPEKRSRVEMTPTRSPRGRGGLTLEAPRVRANGHGHESPVPGTSSGIQLGVDFRRRSGSCASSVSPETPSLFIPGNHVRNIFPDSPPSSPVFTQAPFDSKMENKVKKNDWRGIIGQFNRDLENKLIPTPEHVGDMIRKAILNISTRVSKEIPAQAVEFFNHLVAEYPVSNDESTNYYLSAFTTSSSETGTMAEFLFIVLQTILSDAEAKVNPKALPFFKTLTKMVVNQYKRYKKSDFKLRPPFFVRFLEEETDNVLTYNVYCEKLVGFMFAVKDYSEEFKLVARWVGLLSHHLRRNTQLDGYFEDLVNDFVKIVSKPENSKCRDTIIQSIGDLPLGAAVCLKLLRQKLNFEFTDGGKERPVDEEVKRFLREVSQSESIAGLKSGLQERRRSDDIGPPAFAFHFDKNKKRKKGGVNMKGESYLHRLCRKVSSEEQKNSVGLELDKFLKEKRFPVNPKDHFGNTPLHDAIAHDRFDAVTKFCEYCSQLSLPEELRVDVLAQNEAKETAFHLAASSKQAEEMVTVLRCIADNLQVRDEALKMLNSDGKMPFQLAFTPSTRSLLVPGSGSVIELPYQVGNIRVDIPSRIPLQSIDVKKLIALWSEFTDDPCQ